jgi:hypothetical protein
MKYRLWKFNEQNDVRSTWQSIQRDVSLREVAELSVRISNSISYYKTIVDMRKRAADVNLMSAADAKDAETANRKEGSTSRENRWTNVANKFLTH